MSENNIFPPEGGDSVRVRQIERIDISFISFILFIYNFLLYIQPKLGAGQRT